MWILVVLIGIWAHPSDSPSFVTAPSYVSCIDGHLVMNLKDCPPIPIHNKNDDDPPVGGGGGGGLLGLGGLGGIL